MMVVSAVGGLGGTGLDLNSILSLHKTPDTENFTVTLRSALNFLLFASFTDLLCILSSESQD